MWACKGLFDAEVGKHLLDGLGLHLDAAVVDHNGTGERGRVKDALGHDGVVAEQHGLCGGKRRGYAPCHGLARPFVEHDVEIPEAAPDIGQDVADVPAPALVRTVKDRRPRGLDAVSVAADRRAPVGQEAFGGDDGADRGCGNEEQGLLAALDGKGLKGEVHSILAGHEGTHRLAFLGHDLVPRARGSWLGIPHGSCGRHEGTPAFHATDRHLQQRARMDTCKPLPLCLLDHLHHLALGFFGKPGGGKRAFYTKFTFFLRAVNMTISSAKACSLSAISCRSLS